MEINVFIGICVLVGFIAGIAWRMHSRKKNSLTSGTVTGGGRDGSKSPIKEKQQ
jgi:hypothetical protein